MNYYPSGKKKSLQEKRVNANILLIEMVIITNAKGKNNKIVKGKRAEGLLSCANLSSFFIQSTKFVLVNQI